MALITMRQLLDHAAENDYALPAFNVNNLEYVQAVMRAADATDSPVILQASRGARSYAGDAFLRHRIFRSASISTTATSPPPASRPSPTASRRS